MRNVLKLIALIGLPGLLTACGPQPPATEDAPVKAAGRKAAPSPAPAAAPQPADTTGGAPAAAPVAEDEDLAKLPPLATLPDGAPRLLETARRALLQARDNLHKKSFALATEDFDAANKALKQAKAVVPPPDADALKAIEAVIARLDRENPGTEADVTALLAQVAAARGPLAGAPAPAAGSSSGGAATSSGGAAPAKPAEPTSKKL